TWTTASCQRRLGLRCRRPRAAIPQETRYDAAGEAAMRRHSPQLPHHKVWPKHDEIVPSKDLAKARRHSSERKSDPGRNRAAWRSRETRVTRTAAACPERL